jgi:ArsR family transcriptional regulator
MAPETLFRILSDPTRLRILALLGARAELCVCDLTQALRLSQPMISRHLAQLRAAGLVSDRRDGVWIHYRLRADLPGWARAVLQTALDGIARLAPYRTDRQALRAMARRRARCA